MSKFLTFFAIGHNKRLSSIISFIKFVILNPPNILGLVSKKDTQIARKPSKR